MMSSPKQNAEITKAKWNGLVLLLFILFFSLLFLQYPINNSLPGNSDTWYNINIFEDYGNRLVSFVTGEEIGNSIYPESCNQLFAEPYLGEASFYLFFKLLQFPPIWSYYGFIVLNYALNAWTFYLFLLLIFNSIPVAITGGFMFANSAFAFSQIELLNGIPYFPAILSLYYFIQFIEHKSNKTLFLSMLWAALQIYFSAYVFVYLFMLLASLTLANLKDFLIDKFIFRNIILGIAFVGLIISPFAHYYVFNSAIKEAYNPMTLSLIQNFNLHAEDLVRPLYNNFIYSPLKEIHYESLMKNFNYCFSGILILILALIGIFLPLKRKWFFILCGIIGLLFSFGPTFQWGEFKIKLPLYWVYAQTEIIDFLRIPARAYTLTIIMLVVLASNSIFHLLNKWNTPKLIIPIVILIYAIENIPTKFTLYNSDLYLTPNSLYLKSINQINDHQSVIANLPSSLFENRSKGEVSEFSREYIYAFWQTIHKNNTINGSSGYFPKSRLTNNDLLINITEGSNLQKLISLNNLKLIAFHKNMVLDEQEWKILDFLTQSKALTAIANNQTTSIFKVK